MNVPVFIEIGSVTVDFHRPTLEIWSIAEMWIYLLTYYIIVVSFGLEFRAIH